VVFIPWCLGRGKRERLWEIKHTLLNLPYTAAWLCEAAKMLFAQPTDNISNSEEMVLLGIWYIVFQYIYIIYSVCRRKMQYFEKINSA
jgi:hypothetical protein